jgi:hypothetical protein
LNSQWSDKTWDFIDFDSFGRFYRRLTLTKHAKFIFDQGAVGTSKRFETARAKDRQLKLCPCCRDAIEDPCHVALCLLNPVRGKAITLFGLDLQQRNNHPV